MLTKRRHIFDYFDRSCLYFSFPMTNYLSRRILAKPHLLQPLLAAILVLFLSACASHPEFNNPISVDPVKFEGEWYVIANIPYFAERNKVASKTIYRKRGENVYDDIFESRDGGFDSKLEQLKGKAWPLNTEHTKWRSAFYWVIRSKFEVLHVDDNYQTMLLGHRSRKYAWLMSRSNQVDDETYSKSLRIFEENGYDTSLILKVPQKPDDIGEAGYQKIKL